MLKILLVVLLLLASPAWADPPSAGSAAPDTARSALAPGTGAAPATAPAAAAPQPAAAMPPLPAAPAAAERAASRPMPAVAAQPPVSAPVGQSPLASHQRLLVALAVLVAAILLLAFIYRAVRRRATAKEEKEAKEAEEGALPGRPEERAEEALPPAELPGELPRDQLVPPPTPVPVGKLQAEAEAVAREEHERAERERATRERLARAALELEEAERERARAEAEAKAPRRGELEVSYSLSEGLSRTKKEGFIGRLSRLFSGRKEIDQELLDQVEEVLYKADIGVRTSEKLMTRLKDEAKAGGFENPQRVWRFLKEESVRILDIEAPPMSFPAGRPLVIMIVGVNGVGKTTTIGKLGARYTAEGKKVLIAAGDTFRAAAVEQLEVWAERSGVELVKGRPDADPASVVYSAIQRARKEGFDVVIADTAGRLHTKVPLMEELKKIHKVCGKAVEGAPDEVLLVLDSTNGQNAILQARQFSDAIGLTGIILTKLDGTAKGGIILGISEELRLPIRFIGIGEKVGDLRPFQPGEFVEALFQQENGQV